MIANIPAILKHIGKQGKAEAVGQASLFGPAKQEELKLVELPEWDEDTKLYHEKKVLGHFLSGHPILRVKHKTAGKVTHLCSEYDGMLRSERNCRIVVAGLVTRYESRGRIWLLDLEDDTGSIECMLFSDEADRLAHVLMVNALVAVRIKPRHSETRSSLQVVDAFRLGQFRPKK